jgi:hypothetical protein
VGEDGRLDAAAVSSTYDAAMIDEAMIEDERLLTLDRLDRLVHIEATVWSKVRRTDGRIPRGALRRLTDAADPEAAAAALVAIGLWQTTPNGWQLVDFLARQLSRAQVQARIDGHREAQRRYDLRRSHQSPLRSVDASADPSSDISPDGRTDGPTDRPTDRKVVGGRSRPRRSSTDLPEGSSASRNPTNAWEGVLQTTHPARWGEQDRVFALEGEVGTDAILAAVRIDPSPDDGGLVDRLERLVLNRMPGREGQSISPARVAEGLKQSSLSKEQGHR